nr:hypothetical protein [Clostridia bacterium]
MQKFRRLTALILAFVMLSLPLASCQKQEDSAPNGMKQLSNELVDYNLYVPSGWVEDVSTRFVSAYVSDIDRTNISMEAFELEASDTTLASFWEGYKSDFEATFSEMEYAVEGETMLLGGVPANRYVYTATVTGVQYKFMQVVAIKGLTVYIFTYTAKPDKYDEHLQAVDAILEYFTFD